MGRLEVPGSETSLTPLVNVFLALLQDVAEDTTASWAAPRQ